MKFIKLLLLIIVYINFNMLFACSTEQSLLSKPGNSFYTVDLGKGKKTNAQIFIKINLNTIKSFSSKSTSGAAAKTKSDLSQIKLYLVESNTGSSPTGTITPVSDSGFIYSVTSTNKNNERVDIAYTNVIPNTNGKSYYIAVAGFSSGTIIISNNITNNSAPAEINNEGNYYISSSGGDITGIGQPRTGSVRIDSLYNLVNNATSALVVPLKLLDAQPAIITSIVTITDGGI
jgi:hypothetical protein